MRWWLGGSSVAALVVISLSLCGQEVQLADRGPDHAPAFFAIPTGTAERVDVRNASVFRQRISLDLIDVPLADAVRAIARRGGLECTYRSDVIPSGARVSLRADDITVVAALTDVLVDAGLDVQLTGRDHITLVRRWPAVSAAPTQRAGGTITGQVVDAVTRGPLDQVAVRVEGLGTGSVTGSDGRYTIRDLASGTYRVVARRVGYTPLTRTIAVDIDSAVTADFALAAAPTKLNEVVTTAVGDQRRYEVGNVISTINADSIAPTAPITSLTDLISARAPGVDVLETSGMAGSGEAIRIRGLSSLVLQNDPILIVDGVRQDNSAGGDIGAYFANTFGPANGTHPTPTRLNDIDFTDIESIDVLKGPSASTEYGTDAANGVIVITTKHGTAGRPQWKISAEQTASGIPEHFPNGYYSWGHLTGTTTPVDCPLVPVFGSPASTAGTCIVDSVTRWNPLNHAATTIFGTGNRGKYDLSVSGGTDAVRYFVAGGMSNETGILRMPPVFRQLADTARVGLPRVASDPNSEQQRSVRVNTAIRPGAAVDLTATGSYLATYQRSPDAEDLYLGASSGVALKDPAHYYGYEYLGSFPISPLSELSSIGSQSHSRATGGITANWRPAEWFTAHATAGLDHGSQRNSILNYPLANPAYQGFPPFLGLTDATTDVYSVDLRGTATASLARGVRAVTSGGLQMVDARTVGQTASATGITTTNLTLNGATGPTVTQLANRQATLGGYGEEELSLADRLFLTGALRVDAGSGFGGAYATAVYPKASASWLAIDQGPTTLRVRGAFGESGVQPVNGAATTLYTPTVSYLGGTNVTTYAFNWPGNARLKPERSVEFEGGMDLGAWGNRLSVEVTGYSKSTHDALVNVNLRGSLCCSIYQENIGNVRNTGVEASATVGVIQSQLLTWDVAVNASVNHNKLISLAPGVVGQAVPGGWEMQVPGYPLYGIWLQRVRYADVNHDGTIEANEVTLADSATYIAPSLPTREASLSTHVALWRGALTLGGLVDYRGGYRIMNATAVTADIVGNTRQTNDPRSPVWLQARAVEDGTFSTNSLDAEDGSFARVRELSVTYALPRVVVRQFRVQNLSVTGAVRNLALWTHYTGVDPEVSNTTGANAQGAPIPGVVFTNNDVRQDGGAVPLLRYWVIRLNVGW